MIERIYFLGKRRDRKMMERKKIEKRSYRKMMERIKIKKKRLEK